MTVIPPGCCSVSLNRNQGLISVFYHGFKSGVICSVELESVFQLSTSSGANLVTATLEVADMDVTRMDSAIGGAFPHLPVFSALFLRRGQFLGMCPVSSQT